MSTRPISLAAILSIIVGCQSPEPPSITLPPAVSAATTRASASITDSLTPDNVESVRPLAARTMAAHPAYPAGSMPDPIQTPGAVFVGASKASICAPGYSASVRHVTGTTKNQIFTNYHITGRHGD